MNPASAHLSNFLGGGDLVEESNDLARDMLTSGLLVVHDPGRGGQDNVTELTGRKELDNPLLELTELDVVAGADDTGLVKTIAQKVSIIEAKRY